MQLAMRILEGVTGCQPNPGNRIEVFRNGDEIFPAMLECIRSASHTIDLLTYIYWTGEVAKSVASALAERAAEGLRVRIILDAFGCMAMDDDLVEVMTAAGCQVERFRTASDRATRMHHRTHRKLLICDESVGMTGGVGIAEEWEGDARNPEEWRDTHFRITGPAVRQMTASFIEHWVECGYPSVHEADRFPDLPDAGESTVMVLKGSSGPFWHTIGLGMDALLRVATTRINLTTAYFAPGERMVQLMCNAAERGVEITLLLPGTHMDKRVVHLASADEYGRLMASGVAIHHYERTMLHAKVLTVDDEIALIGSANIDERSMRHNEEIALAVFDRELVRILDDHMAEDLALSERIDPEDWEERPIWKKWAEAVIDPIEGLL
ncbi:MAG TPA: phospholipase D-like domain-containing protein [Euzebya sp.]|nr:phospholipase D-like domain-containing protein [Euzebya sp.]